MFKSLSLLTISTGLISLAFVPFFISRFGLKGAFVAQNFAYLLLVSALALGFRNVRIKIDKNIIKQISKYSVLIGLSSVSYFFYTKIDIVILGQFNYMDQVGYYELINKAFVIIIMPFAILAQTIAPNISSLAALNKYEDIRKKLFRYSKLVIPASIIISVLFYILFPIALKFGLPKYYTPVMLSALTILISLLPIKIWGILQTQGFIVYSGYAKLLTVSTAIGGIANVILDYVLITSMGFTGVFWATLIVHSVSILAVTLIYNSSLKKKTVEVV